MRRVTKTANFDIQTKAEFRDALRGLLAAADRNDVCIDGASVTCREPTDLAWEAQVARLTQPDDD